ncbi:E3 ubiquitin-protein ligase TRIP12-like [Eurosta solidaginis]|uniref:E3 ubiquitin-protein ligase TRIP12-like n=1 Tax=Eurosta solidaginis TaxID=178769 RepID=UPI00353178A8
MSGGQVCIIQQTLQPQQQQSPQQQQQLPQQQINNPQQQGVLQQTQQQQMNMKTKTALANMLNSRLGNSNGGAIQIQQQQQTMVVAAGGTPVPEQSLQQQQHPQKIIQHQVVVACNAPQSGMILHHNHQQQLQYQQRQLNMDQVGITSSPNDSALNMIIEHETQQNQSQLSQQLPRERGDRSPPEISDIVSSVATITTSTSMTYVNTPHGLFPMPLGKSSKLPQVSKAKAKFKFLGKFMAKAVMDSRMLDLPFSIPFYRWLLNEEYSVGLADLARVAPEVQSTLVRLQDVVLERDQILNESKFDAMEKTEKIESLDLDGCLIADLGLDFVLPGYANIELCRGGRDTPVTIHNLHQYISLVTYWFLVEGVQKQFEALREGFDSVFPTQRLRMFYPEELENVFCGSGACNYQRWDVKMLQDCCRTDHGFTQDSQAIQYLYDILSSYNRDEQRLFLQFVTGSPRLPTGGFKSLTPQLTIVRKTLDGNQNPNEYLPSVMTCVNYLKLPDYSSQEVMREKLKVAANEGSMSFHLS